MGLAAAVFMLSLGAAGASLEEAPDFVRAQELYVDLECEKALPKLTKLQQNTNWHSRERGQIALWQALCFAQLSQNEKRDQALVRALQLDPNVEAPAFTPPKVREALEAARAREQTKAKKQQGATSMEGAVSAEPGSELGTKSQNEDASARSGTIAVGFPTDAESIRTGVMVLGGLAILGGVVSAGFAVPNIIAARDPQAFQQDASENARLANQQLVAGAVFAGTGILLLGGAVAFFGASGE